MPHQLSGLSLNRVDLVPDGSNPDAHIVLFKSKGAKMPQPKKKAAARKPPVKKSGKADTRKKSKQRGDDDEDDEEDDEPKVTKGRRTKASDDDEDDDLEVEDDDEIEDDDEEEVEKSDDDEEDDEEEDGDEEEEEDEDDEPRSRKKSSKKPAKRPAKKSKRPAKKVAKASDDDDDDELEDDDDDELEDLDEEVLKSLSPKVRARIEKTHRIAKEAQEIAKAERDKRVTMEFIQKAKKDIPNLSGSNEEKGELLKALFSGEPISKADAKAIYKLLKTGDNAVRSLMMETGVSKRRTRDDEDESAQAQLEEIRDEILKSKGNKLTKQQAMAKACEEHPELYAQHRMEKSRNRRSAVADVD